MFLPLFFAPVSVLLSQVAQAPHPLLVGYFPQWGLYDQPQYLVKNLAASNGAAMLDQVNYAQGFVTGGRCSVADPNADINYTYSAAQSVDGVADAAGQTFRGSYNQMLKLKRLNPKLKVLISLEGRAPDFAADAQPEARRAFVSSCIDLFIKGKFGEGNERPGLFDGLDIDWEFPGAEDAVNYLALLTEFRTQLDALRPGLRLTIAVGHSPRMSGAIGNDLSDISRLVDQVGLMSYDYTGPWVHSTGFIAPFTTTPQRPRGTVQRSIDDYLAAGVPAAKLIVGVPFYGYGWRTVPEENNGLFQEGEPIRGDRPFSYIETLIPGSTVFREAGSETPWLFDGDVFWTYEDAKSVRRKADYAVERQLGGLMIWELGEDDAAGTLLHAAYGGLHAGGGSLGVLAAAR